MLTTVVHAASSPASSFASRGFSPTRQQLRRRVLVRGVLLPQPRERRAPAPSAPARPASRDVTRRKIRSSRCSSVVALVEQQLLRQHAGGLDVRRVVQQRQRVQRRVRADLPHAAHRPRAARRTSSSAPPCAARTCRGSGGTAPRRVSGVYLIWSRLISSHTPGGWYGFTGGPPILSTSSPLAASAWSRIMKLRQPVTRAAGEQAVRGVLLEQLGRHLRRLAVRAARDDQPVHRLHVPAALAELDGEPVEQLRVRSASRPAGRSRRPSSRGRCRRTSASSG